MSRKEVFASAAGVEAPTPQGPLVVSEAEAGRLVGLSRRSLQRLRLVGGGPPYCVLTPGGGRIGYQVTALHEWLAAQTVANTSAATVAMQAPATVQKSNKRDSNGD